MEPTPRQTPGGTVLVQGTGGVRVFAVQLAHASGLRVIVTSSSADKIERLRTRGSVGLPRRQRSPDDCRILVAGRGPHDGSRREVR